MNGAEKLLDHLCDSGDLLKQPILAFNPSIFSRKRCGAMTQVLRRFTPIRSDWLGFLLRSHYSLCCTPQKNNNIGLKVVKSINRPIKHGKCTGLETGTQDTGLVMKIEEDGTASFLVALELCAACTVAGWRCLWAFMPDSDTCSELMSSVLVCASMS